MGHKTYLPALLILSLIIISCSNQGNIESTISANNTQIANLQNTLAYEETNEAIETAIAETLDARVIAEISSNLTQTTIAGNVEKTRIPASATPAYPDSNEADPTDSPPLNKLDPSEIGQFSSGDFLHT